MQLLEFNLFELYCPGLSEHAEGGLSIIVGCVHSYQSLIAGLLAIIAAYVAARPVWRQLKDTNLQSKITQRDTLAQRMHEAMDRFQRAEKEMEEPLDKLMRTTYGPGGDPLEIDDHNAHGLYLTVSGKLDWYLEKLKDTEAPEIELAKVSLYKSREELARTLSDAYWPAAHSQNDEDYSLSDDEWQKVVEKAKEAKVQAAERASDFCAAWQELGRAQSNWVKMTRQKIASLDTSIDRSAIT